MKCEKCGKRYSGKFCPNCAADAIDAVLDGEGTISDIPTKRKKLDFSRITVPKVIFLAVLPFAVVFVVLLMQEDGSVPGDGYSNYMSSDFADPADTATDVTDPPVTYDSWESCLRDSFSGNCKLSVNEDSNGTLIVNVSNVNDLEKAVYQASSVVLHMSAPVSIGLSPIKCVNFLFESGMSIVIMKNSGAPAGVISFIHFGDGVKNAAELQTYYDGAFGLFDATKLFE